MAFFFFYEAFIQVMTKHFPHRFFTGNSFLLLAGLLALIGVFIWLKKTKRRFPQLYLFLNTTLLVYILVDAGWLIGKLLYPPVNPLSVYSLEKGDTTTPCATCAKPNVYFLLFDEYASSLSLKEQFNYDNSCLDSFLIKQGFHINKQSRANYNLTPFSIASVLNMSYIEGLKDPGRIMSQDYTNTYHLIRNSKVISLFSREGYEVKNYSIFDLAGQPTKAWQSFLPLKTRLITARTLAERLNRHSTSLLVRYLGVKYFVVREYMKYYTGNEEFLKAVASEADQKTSRPRFVYAHFMMPHFPYLFDSSGNRRSDQQIYEEKFTNPATSYLNYLPYTNKRLAALVLHIRQNDSNAVILLCGDHGYRGWTNKQPIRFQFQNLNAVYFPDHDYSRWDDKVSFVNQFRIVFNQLFDTKYPLVKDSAIALKEE
ncbi:sulfatase-like hydrolase/transferase [Puia dinghuensis]|nr:sulfatase-like hydrolase/transferase [Puia dinghuensis]